MNIWQVKVPGCCRHLGDQSSAGANLINESWSRKNWSSPKSSLPWRVWLWFGVSEHGVRLQITILVGKTWENDNEERSDNPSTLGVPNFPWKTYFKNFHQIPSPTIQKGALSQEWSRGMWITFIPFGRSCGRTAFDFCTWSSAISEHQARLPKTWRLTTFRRVNGKSCETTKSLLGEPAWDLSCFFQVFPFLNNPKLSRFFGRETTKSVTPRT